MAHARNHSTRAHTRYIPSAGARLRTTGVSFYLMSAHYVAATATPPSRTPITLVFTLVAGRDLDWARRYSTMPPRASINRAQLLNHSPAICCRSTVVKPWSSA